MLRRLSTGRNATIASFGVKVITSLALTLIAALVRTPDRLSTPQFWAEDAAVFYIEAEVDASRSIAMPYAGYLHLYPRLVAYAGRFFPVVHVPAVYAAGAFAMCWMAVLSALVATSDRPPWVTAAFAVALLTVPFASEVWFVLTNAQWIGATVLLLIISSPAPASLRTRILVAAGVVLVSLTGPFALILLPCALMRAYLSSDGWSTALVAIVAAAGLVCVLTLATFPREPTGLSIAERLSSLALGRPKLFAMVCMATATLAGGALLGYLRKDRLLLLCGLSGLLFLAAAAIAAPAPLVAALPQVGGRYAFVPWVATVWTLILLTSYGYRVCGAILVMSAVLCAANITLPPRSSHDWVATARCLEMRPICPATVNPGWNLLLPGRGAAP